MKWKQCNWDSLPYDRQKVLISVDGIYYPATYIENEKVFRVDLDGQELRFTVRENQIYWTEDLNSFPDREGQDVTEERIRQNKKPPASDSADGFY